MENQEGVHAPFASCGYKRSWAERTRLETYFQKVMLCCISLNNTDTVKKHGINLELWCNCSNMWKGWANLLSTNVLRASSHPNLKPPFKPGVAAAPRREQSVIVIFLGQQGLFVSLRVTSCEKAQNLYQVTNKKQQPPGWWVGKDSRGLGSTIPNYMVLSQHTIAWIEAGGQCTGLEV